LYEDQNWVVRSVRMLEDGWTDPHDVRKRGEKKAGLQTRVDLACWARPTRGKDE